MQHGLVLRAAARPGGLIAIQVSGVIDAHTLDRFEGALGRALEHGARSLLLDCAELRYVSSSGFGELIRYHDQLRDRGGTLVLARVAPKVAVILEMLGLKSLIPVVDSLDEGLRIASGAPPTPAASPAPAVPAAEPSPGPAPRVLPDPSPRADGAASPSPPAVAPRGEAALDCPFCDASLERPPPGSHLCSGCGAPFALSADQEVRWEWAPEDPERVEALHLTLDARPHSLAALGGLLEGMLGERGAAHVSRRRFAREAAQACRLLAEHAYAAWADGRDRAPGGSRRAGPIHLLVLAGEDHLVVQAVDRGRALETEAEGIFATQAEHLAGFAYRTLGRGVHAIEFRFSWRDAEVPAP